MKTVFVTGANGFVGRPLCRRLLQDGWQVRCGLRTPDGEAGLPSGVIPMLIPDVREIRDWSPLFDSVDAVVHLVARTHVMKERGHDVLTGYRHINLHGSLRVADGAVRARVPRFIYMSSIKAVGEGASFSYEESTPTCPEDAYGTSKREAEQALQNEVSGSPTSLTVIRPPLLYGAGVRGNLLRLLRLVKAGVPLPLGSVENARSLCYVENLVDATATLLRQRSTEGTFHVADADSLSTPQLLKTLAAAMGMKLRLAPAPVTLLRLFGRLSGRAGEVERLVGSLTVSTSRIQQLTDWTPPYSVVSGMREMVDHFLADAAFATEASVPTDDIQTAA